MRLLDSPHRGFQGYFVYVTVYKQLLEELRLNPDLSKALLKKTGELYLSQSQVRLITSFKFKWTCHLNIFTHKFILTLFIRHIHFYILNIKLIFSFLYLILKFSISD